MVAETRVAVTGGAPLVTAHPRVDRGHADDRVDAVAFEAMRAMYQPAGGLARGDDLARLLEDRARGDYVSLARLIVTNRIFGFEWQQSFWIPMFQFNLDDLSVRRGLRQVLGELASEFEGWRLAAWFIEPNAWLKQGRPVDLIDSNLSEVVQAARADRFVAAA
ncbi:MAG: hypothetical protein ABI460_12935 [Caldimonas sp.]